MDNHADLSPAQLEFLCGAVPGFAPGFWSVELAGQAGSQRRFLRISQQSPGGKSFVLVVWDSTDEDWRRFLTIEEELSPHIDNLPRIIAHDDRHGLILEEDLGAMTLKRYCGMISDDIGDVEKTYRKVLDSLCEWQAVDIAASTVISSRSMDTSTFLWETDYFARHCVTEFCGCERLLTPQWDLERTRMAAEASSLRRTCTHRDFQSENIMLYQGRVCFVDFQGARLGPPEYDTASLLFDPYARFLDNGVAERLFGYYCARSPIGDARHRSFYLCAAQRLMQALGAYGNLSIHKGKSWYKEFIPVALERLCYVLKRLPDFPYCTMVAYACNDACSLIRTGV